jgi:GLPGLI family protein
MKTLFRSFIIVITAAAALSFNSVAQTPKPFRGIVTYNITYSGNIDAATLANQLKMVTVSIYDNKQKLTISMAGVGLDLIYDGDKKESIVLIDQMGQKMYYKMLKEEIEADMTEKGTYEIKYLDESKTIAGYNCKKALYISTDSEGEKDTSIAYYTQELGGEALNYGTSFHGLKGFPLEYIAKEKDITSTFTATEVKKGKVKDTQFMLPADYIELPAELKEQIKAGLNGGEE